MVRLLSLAAAILLMLGGCAVVDPVDQRYDTITRSLAKARDESIFLNIIRASHDWPLSFSTIANVSPSMTNTSTLGLPSFLLGPNAARSLNPGFSPGRDVIFGNQNNAIDALSVTSNFNVSTQETTTFYEGFLRPVDLQILNYFIRQGYSRELLFWLFTESVEVGPPAHAIGFQYNPPYDYGCPQDPKKRCFRQIVEIAVITGLTVETRTVQSGRDGGGDGKSKRENYARFCFSPVLAQSGQAAMGGERVRELEQYMDRQQRRPICGDPWPNKTSEFAQRDTLDFHVGKSEFRIVTRSAYGIFQFLGKLLKTGDELNPITFPGRREEELQAQLISVPDDSSLLHVVRGPGQECFVRTWFFDGEYCVPEVHSENTKRIFGLLAQLIALETQSGDLSITPTVRIIQ
jgi:hypothetical protein